MAMQLTYADRASMLEAFDSLKATSSETDEQILVAIGQWARELRPRFGFERGLTRDVTALSRYLSTHEADHDVAAIARGALLYVLRPTQSRGVPMDELGHLDQAFVCGYAVHEIRTRLGESAIYSPPRLTQAERKRAEDLFLNCLDDPALDDADLIEKSRSIATGLGGLSACGFLQRLRKNIDFLASALANPNLSREQRCYARAALGYVACEEDAISDHLGIVGYLDDNFIAQLAVDFIEPDREPWVEFLDQIVGAWPFLDDLVIDDGSGGRPVSEYMMINAALTCTELHGEDFPSSLLLVVPFSGPTPFLLGFMTAVGMIQDAGQEELTEDSFQPGQKVLVDNRVIAVFSGFEYINDRKVFGLTQYRSERGQRLSSTHYWPLSDLCRLVPADSLRATRGQLTHDLSRADIPLPALDHLLNRSGSTRVSAVSKRVVVVMPLASAHDMAASFSLYGHSLKDAVPMGHLTSEQEVTPWSAHFGAQEPLLIFVSDLDVACAFVEDDPDLTQVVIVSATGRNAGKTASLRRLQQLGVPTLTVCPERTADALSLAEDDRVGVWQWHSDDFPTLLWPAVRVGSDAGPVATHERRLQVQSSSATELRTVSFPVAGQAYEAARQIGALARVRGDERLAELDEIVMLTFGVMSRLLRSAAPLPEHSLSAKELEARLGKLKTIRQGSLFLSDEERGAAAEAETLLRELFDELRRDNPKATLVHEMLAAQPGLVIICPDARLRPDLERAYSGLGTRVLASCAPDDADLEGALLPGWFRKERMATLLVPPVARPLYLTLYGIEQRWYEDFVRERRKARYRRSGRSNRGKLYPGVEGWRKRRPELPEPTVPTRRPDLQELDAVQEHIRTSYRQSVRRAAMSDGSESEVSAYLVIFEGDMYGLLTESYKANVVTHLLDASVGDLDDKADVKQKSTRQLRPGDALLFHLGSDKDVIRTAADKILPPGVREMSSLWRTALLDHVTRQELTSEDVWKQLRSKGCPLQHQTIRVWLENDSMIAPKAYRRDIRIVAEVTGDETLAGRMENVLAAARQVFSAHLRASHQLARQVLARAVHVLKEEGEQSRLLEIEPNVVVVRVVEVDDQRSMVRASMANRLLEGDQWLE